MVLKTTSCLFFFLVVFAFVARSCLIYHYQAALKIYRGLFSSTKNHITPAISISTSHLLKPHHDHTFPRKTIPSQHRKSNQHRNRLNEQPSSDLFHINQTSAYKLKNNFGDGMIWIHSIQADGRMTSDPRNSQNVLNFDFCQKL